MFLFMYICRDYVWKDTQEIDKIKLAFGRRSPLLKRPGWKWGNAWIMIRFYSLLKNKVLIYIFYIYIKKVMSVICFK